MLPNTVKPRGNSLRAAFVAAGIALFTATGAAAAPVSDWSFTLNNGFTAFEDLRTSCLGGNTICSDAPPAGYGINPASITGEVSGSGANAVLLGLGAPIAWSKLEWPRDQGVPNPANSYIAVGKTNGNFDSVTEGVTLVTNGGFVDTVRISHNNQTQDLGTNFLNTATLTDLIMITPIAPPPFPDGTTLTPPPIEINIHFVETLNSVHPVDIFVLDVESAAFADADMDGIYSLIQNFDFMGVGYSFEVALTEVGGSQGLHELTDFECQLAGVAAGCIGLTTAENALTEFQASLRISTREIAVPEPGTLAILGLGLVGLGFARRRRTH